MQQIDLFDWIAQDRAAAGDETVERDETAAAATALRAHLSGTTPLCLSRLQDVVRVVAKAPSREDNADLLGAVCRCYGAGDATFGPYAEVTAAIDGLAALPAERRRPVLDGLVRAQALEPHRLPANMRAEWAALSPNWAGELATFLRDGSPALKRAACRVVADGGLRRLAPVVRELLQDKVPRVAASAAVALGRLGDPAGRGQLENMLTQAIDGRPPPLPVGDVLDGLLPIATDDSVVMIRRAARDLAGADGTAAEATLAELDPD